MELFKRKSYLYMLIAFLAALVPRILLCMQSIPVRTISDEVATISGAAYFAGLDWSGVISKAGYYGSGFYGLFFWVFKLTQDPVLIYRCMLAAGGVAQALTAVIAFIMMKKYFGIRDNRILCLFSILSSYMVVTTTTIAYNEHILILLTWLTALLLLQLISCRENKKKRYIYTAILMLVLSYGLTIHTRAYTMWIACAFVVAIYGIVNRKWLISWVMAALFGAVGFLCSSGFVDFIQSSLWNVQGEPIRNSSVSLALNFSLTDPLTWFSGLLIALGQLNTISIFTGGFMLVCFVILTWILWRVLKDRFTKSQTLDLAYKDHYLVISIFCLACVSMTILAQTISWLPGVIDGISLGYGTKTYALKAITYIRYFGPYLGPAFMAGLVFVYQNKELRMKLIKPAIVIFVLLQVFWVVAAIPYVQNNFYTSEVFIGLARWKSGDGISAWTYQAGVIAASIAFLFYILLIKKGKLFIAGILLGILLVNQHVYFSINNDQYYAKKTYSKQVNAGYALVKKMEKKNMDVPYEIYVYDGDDKADHQIFYLYQFMLNRYKVIPRLPEKTEDAELIFTNTGKAESLLEEGYVCIKLDKNEFVYSKGEMLRQVQSLTK